MHDGIRTEVLQDFPTRVGMARKEARPRTGGPRFPHPRGDGPKQLSLNGPTYEISPPAWGWPDVLAHHRPAVRDFPTRVGMARLDRRRERRQTRFPHPRGDGPRPPLTPPPSAGISPPAWGWPGRGKRLARPASDFPTRVGMARRQHPMSDYDLRFPHPRGDGPTRSSRLYGRQAISPPAWGWPAGGMDRNPNHRDFPTRVGMARFTAF